MTILEKLWCSIIRLTNMIFGSHPAAMPSEFTNPAYIPPASDTVFVDVADAAARLAIAQAIGGCVVRQVDDSSVWGLVAHGVASNASDWRCLMASAIARGTPPESAAHASQTLLVRSMPPAGQHTINIGDRVYTIAERAKQSCYVIISGVCTSSGDITVTVTGALMASPKSVTVALVQNDSASTIAGKIKAAFDVEEITGSYTISGVGGMARLTALVAAENDPTFSFTVGGGHGVQYQTATTNPTGNYLAPNAMFRGADEAEFVANLAAVINGAAGAGDIYGAGTVPHEDGTAVAALDGVDNVLIFTAGQIGAAGNAIAVYTSYAPVDGGGWLADTLAGGSDGTPAAMLGQECIVNEESFYKCSRLSPVKWIGPFTA